MRILKWVPRVIMNAICVPEFVAGQNSYIPGVLVFYLLSEIYEFRYHIHLHKSWDHYSGNIEAKI